MADKIFSKDIFGDDLTKKQIKQFEALIDTLEKLEEQQKVILKQNTEGLKINAKEYKDVKQNLKLLAEVEKIEQQRQKAAAEKVKKLKQLQDLKNKKLTTDQKEIALAEKKRKRAEASARAELKLNGAYSKQSKRLNELRKQYKDLILTQGKETKETKRLRKQIQGLDRDLKRVDASAGQFQRSVGNYGKAFGGLKNLASSALPIAGVAGVMSVLKNGIGIIMDFEKATSGLKAILGDDATKENMDLLGETARNLGASTAFTASQVVELQTEFAKLGFSAKQIDNATASTLDLALASGTTLAESASVVGNTLGGFGLKATETQRVVDVMASSFTKSALDMEKFKESMKVVAPASKAVGKSIEETTALLGTLANAGISGTSSATALRASFINLNKAGLTLEQGLEKVKNSEDKLATATELVGKNASTAFLVLAEGTETTIELEEELLKATGTAEQMASVMSDNLAGDVDKLKSAWEGFVLSLDGSESVIGNVLRTLTQGLTDALTGLMNLDIGFKLFLNDVSDLSNKDVDRLLKGGWQSEDGINITELVKETDNDINNLADLLANEDELRKKWVKWLGEDEEDAITLFNRYFENRKNFFLEPQEAINISGSDGESSGKKEVEKTITRLKELQKILKDLKAKRLGLADENGILDPQKLKETNDEIAETEIKIQDLLDNLNGMRLKKGKVVKGFKTKKATDGEIIEDDTEEEEEIKNVIDYQAIITEIIEEQTQKRIDAIDREIDANKRRQDTLRLLAIQGNQDAQNNLALEEKRQAELERKKEQALRRQKLLEMGLAVVSTYSGYAEDDPNTALSKTFTDTTALLAFIQGLQSFDVGSEYLTSNENLDGKGGFLALNHEGERIMTTEQNAPLKGISNIELSNLGKAYKEGNLQPTIKVDNTEVVAKLNEIANKPTYLGRDYDKTENAIVETVISKGRIEKNHIKTGKNKL